MLPPSRRGWRASSVAPFHHFDSEEVDITESESNDEDPLAD
eukprot:COSAG05_NODE_10731_length_549_cov_0.853333_1_plen_40_part_01